MKSVHAGASIIACTILGIPYYSHIITYPKAFLRIITARISVRFRKVRGLGFRV